MLAKSFQNLKSALNSDNQNEKFACCSQLFCKSKLYMPACKMKNICLVIQAFISLKETPEFLLLSRDGCFLSFQYLCPWKLPFILLICTQMPLLHLKEWQYLPNLHTQTEVTQYQKLYCTEKKKKSGFPRAVSNSY